MSSVVFRRFVQETSYYCGPACAQMAYDFYGDALPDSQATIYTIIRERNVEGDRWYSDPGALNSVIDDAGAASTGLILTTDPLDVARYASWSIEQKVHPIVVLVRGGSHWCLVRRVVYAEELPTAVLSGVFLVDPWPDAPDESFIPIDVLLEEYLTPNVHGQIWRDTLIAIGPSGEGWQAADIEIRGNVMGGGGIFSPADPLAAAVDAVNKMGFPKVRAPFGGGGDAIVLSVFDHSTEQRYRVLTLDASEDSTLGDFVLVAQTEGDLRILELTSGLRSVKYLTDAEAEQAARRLFPNASSVLVREGLHWISASNSRSRFSVLRSVMVDERDILLNPQGELVDQTTPQMGGA